MARFAERRYGKFKADVETLTENAETCLALFGTCIVLRAEYMFQEDAIVYELWSPMFDELGEGEIIPGYSPEVDEDGNVTWTRDEGE